jgi:ABC-2 type transport system permease protein
MPRPLEVASNVLPLTYVVEAMQDAVRWGSSRDTYANLLVVLCCVVGAIALGALTLRRRTP